ERLTGASSADGAPLAHTDAMSVALPAKRYARQHAFAVLRFDGKIGAGQHLATGHPHHVPDVVAPDVEDAALGFDLEHPDAPRWRAAPHTDRFGCTRTTARHRCVTLQILVERGIHLRGRQGP